MIIEDDSITALSIERKINSYQDKQVIGKADTEDVGFDLIQNSSPDFALTDIDLKQGNGISLINRIRALNNNIRFLIMTGYDMNLYKKSLYSMKGILNSS